MRKKRKRVRFQPRRSPVAGTSPPVATLMQLVASLGSDWSASPNAAGTAALREAKYSRVSGRCGQGQGGGYASKLPTRTSRCGGCLPHAAWYCAINTPGGHRNTLGNHAENRSLAAQLEHLDVKETHYLRNPREGHETPDLRLHVCALPAYLDRERR